MIQKQITSKKFMQICRIVETGSTLLKNAMEKLIFSTRAYDRILKVARTISDLDAAENVKPGHLAETIQYRNLDRETWGD